MPHQTSLLNMSCFLESGDICHLVTYQLQSARRPAGTAQVPKKKKGAGTKMLDDMRKKGKPITPKLEEMALWLDGLDTSTLDDGQVRLCSHLCHAFIACNGIVSCVNGLQCCFV